jgi:hypothetical protein
MCRFHSPACAHRCARTAHLRTLRQCLQAIRAELDAQLEALPRRDIAKRALANSFIVKVRAAALPQWQTVLEGYCRVPLRRRRVSEGIPS